MKLKNDRPIVGPHEERAGPPFCSMCEDLGETHRCLHHGICQDTPPPPTTPNTMTFASGLRGFAAFVRSPAFGSEDADMVARKFEALADVIEALMPSPDRVQIPTNADQASGMILVAENWLRAHAPERLSSKSEEVLKALVAIVDRIIPPVPAGHENDFLTVVDRAEAIQARVAKLEQARDGCEKQYQEKVEEISGLIDQIHDADAKLERERRLGIEAARAVRKEASSHVNRLISEMEDKNIVMIDRGQLRSLFLKVDNIDVGHHVRAVRGIEK